MLATTSPFPQYFDRDGSPLDGGLLFFGEPSDNPETAPVTVYWDVAGTQPAAQPIRTINGYAARSGAPALVFAADDYSLTVKDKSGRQISYTRSSSDFTNDFVLQASIQALKDGLANDDDPDLGPGMIGFGDEDYDEGTVGRHLQLNYSKNYVVGSLSDLIKSEAINVRGAPYFAGGIGVTDDTAAFAAALATGRSVYVPDGTYTSGPQTLTANGQAVLGDGRTATIKPTDLTLPLFTLAGDNQSIKHLVFDGANVTADAEPNFNAIKITGTRGQVIDNRFIGSWTRTINLTTALYCVIRDNNIDGMRKRGVSVQGGTFNRIEDNMIFDASLTAPLDALVYIDNAPSVWVVDNHITRGSGVGIKAVATPPPGGFSNTYLVIEGNDIDNLDNYAISVDGYWNVQVHHNWCSGGQGGGSTGQISIANTNLFYVAHNDVKGTLNNGQGITLTTCKNGFVHNNTVEYSVKGVVIAPDCEQVIFRDNIVGQLTGLPPTGSVMQYGFYSPGLSNANGCEFIDNKVINVTVQEYSGIGSVSQLRPRTISTETGGEARVKNLVFSPGAVAPATNNGDVTFRVLSNTQLRIELRGTDGTVRGNTLTLS